MSMDDYTFSLDFKVRDYECDLQGVVNNANYQHYLEHARHEFLLERGIDFAALTAQGIHLVVTRIEMDYKRPLVSGDVFQVRLNIHRPSKVRFQFQQDIFRMPDETLILQGLVTGTALNQRGRPAIPAELETLF
ncbi:MAG: acyl-CoA thioester hydrolase [Kiritimatiellia bacterium]|jgi:acyl-CoA thioester hydrolase